MIRLRNKHGDLLPIDNDIGFVEVCNSDGAVACSVYTDANGFVHLVTAGDREADRYSQIFNVTFARIVDVPAILK